MINFLLFQEKFPNDESCKYHFKKLREAHNVKCKKCSSTDHYWLKSKEQWECKKCQFRTTLKSGTILQSSNLNFYTWYKTIFAITQSDKILNSSELKRILGLKRYEPVWYMMHKLRTLMLANHNEIMNSTEEEVALEIFKINNRKVHYGELRRFFESIEIEKQTQTHAIKVRFKKYERVKIIPYYSFIPQKNINKILFSVKHLRGTLDVRKSFFRRIFSINCNQEPSKNLNRSKESNLGTVNFYKKEIYGNWRTVAYKYLQLYFDEISFNLNYNNKREKLQAIIGHGINFDWYNSG